MKLHRHDGDVTFEYEVTELCLCEQNHLILKPNKLYTFRTDVTCKSCVELEKEGKQE